MKRCTKCGKEKELAAFSRCNKYNTHRSECKSCQNAYNVKHRSKNKERSRQRMKEWRAKNPLKNLLLSARERAKRKRIEFSISESDLSIPSHCPVLGIKLEPGKGSGGHQPASPTIDRIDNSKGYVKGNVIVVSWRANTLKRDATMEELQAIVDFYS